MRIHLLDFEIQLQIVEPMQCVDSRSLCLLLEWKALGSCAAGLYTKNVCVLQRIVVTKQDF